jgi:hypothetical protein
MVFGAFPPVIKNVPARLFRLGGAMAGLSVCLVLSGCVFAVTSVPEGSLELAKRVETLEKRVESLEQRPVPARRR